MGPPDDPTPTVDPKDKASGKEVQVGEEASSSAPLARRGDVPFETLVDLLGGLSTNLFDSLAGPKSVCPSLGDYPFRSEGRRREPHRPQKRVPCHFVSIPCMAVVQGCQKCCHLKGEVPSVPPRNGGAQEFPKASVQVQRGGTFPMGERSINGASDGRSDERPLARSKFTWHRTE